MSNPTKEKITFSHYTDSVSDFRARKVNGNWHTIEAWSAGKLPKVSRHPIAAPYMIAELERNQRELAL